MTKEYKQFKVKKTSIETRVREEIVLAESEADVREGKIWKDGSMLTFSSGSVQWIVSGGGCGECETKGKTINIKETVEVSEVTE